MVHVIRVCWQLASKLCVPLLCVQWQTPDNGQKNSLKHVEFYSKNKFQELVQLVGFIIRIFHYSRWPEPQISLLISSSLSSLELQPKKCPNFSVEFNIPPTICLSIFLKFRPVFSCLYSTTGKRSTAFCFIVCKNSAHINRKCGLISVTLLYLAVAHNVKSNIYTHSCKTQSI